MQPIVKGIPSRLQDLIGTALVVERVMHRLCLWAFHCCSGLPIWMYFAFRRVDVPIRHYVSYVVVPAYSFIAIWSGLVLILNSVFSPRTFGGLAVFTILTVLAFWLAAFSMTRTRWRRAARGQLVRANPEM